MTLDNQKEVAKQKQYMLYLLLIGTALIITTIITCVNVFHYFTDPTNTRIEQKENIAVIGIIGYIAFGCIASVLIVIHTPTKSESTKTKAQIIYASCGFVFVTAFLVPQFAITTPLVLIAFFISVAILTLPIMTLHALYRENTPQTKNTITQTLKLQSIIYAYWFGFAIIYYFAY